MAVDMVVIWHCVFSGPKRLARQMVDEFTGEHMPAIVDRATRTAGAGDPRLRGQGDLSTRFHQLAEPVQLFHPPMPATRTHKGEWVPLLDKDGVQKFEKPEPVLDDDGEPMFTGIEALVDDDGNPVWDDTGDESVEILTDDVDRAVEVGARHQFRLRMHSDSGFADLEQAAAVEAAVMLPAPDPLEQLLSAPDAVQRVRGLLGLDG